MISLHLMEKHAAAHVAELRSEAHDIRRAREARTTFALRVARALRALAERLERAAGYAGHTAATPVRRGANAARLN